MGGIELSLETILDNIDAGIVIYDADGNFVFVNTVMVNWRNIPRSEYLHLNISNFMDVIDVCVFDLVCKEKRRISRLQYYQDYQKKGGPTRMRIVTGTPIFDQNGNIKNVITLLQDIQDFEDLAQALKLQNKIIGSDLDFKIARPEESKIIAFSPAMRQLLELAGYVAMTDSTVLISGESGTGKEVLSHYIHNCSSRSKGPLIEVNCAAFPENLLEAELFGYEKGSFTGALSTGKAGLAEAADGGTLFLDEINSLPLSMQGKVLRMIEEKSIQRIGAVKPKKVDFRLIAATNHDLGKMVREETFRADLYYRLNVVPLTVPPLRSRREDIIPLCRYFLDYFSERYNIVKRFSPEVLQEISQFTWPGNVRELKNFVERITVMTPYNTVEITSIPKTMLLSEAELEAEPEENSVQQVTTLSRERIIAALEACGEHREKTAKYLGISRRLLQYKIREYHISSRCKYSE